MKKVLLALGILLVLAGMAAGGAWVWWNRSLDEFAAAPYGSAEEKVVEVPTGSNMKALAQLLQKQGLVADANKFYWMARREKRDRIKAGEYAFSGPLLPGKVLEDIEKGHVRLYRCTVAEGLWMEDIAAQLEKCGYGDAKVFLKLARDPDFAKAQGVPAKTLEGYLYPDTYSFPRAPKPEQILAKMVSRFHEEYRRASNLRLKDVTLDEHQTATLASIIEKETGVPEERPHISCVFHNRIKQNMKLETDPTVIYAKKLRLGAWDGNITRADLLEPHDYNTYTRKGLPPGPIASAGAKAIEAALHPSSCNDLFFVACGGGTHQFCPDYDCHLRYVAKCQLHHQ